jgi:hypothetical protein
VLEEASRSIFSYSVNRSQAILSKEPLKFESSLWKGLVILISMLQHNGSIKEGLGDRGDGSERWQRGEERPSGGQWQESLGREWSQRQKKCSGNVEAM